MQTTNAIQVLKYNGEHSELELLKTLHASDGSSLYTLSKALNWSYGKTERAVNRLLEKGLVKSEHKIENGRAQKIISETKATELIDINKREFELMERFLKDKAK